MRSLLLVLLCLAALPAGAATPCRRLMVQVRNLTGQDLVAEFRGSPVLLDEAPTLYPGPSQRVVTELQVQSGTDDMTRIYLQVKAVNAYEQVSCKVSFPHLRSGPPTCPDGLTFRPRIMFSVTEGDKVLECQGTLTESFPD